MKNREFKIIQEFPNYYLAEHTIHKYKECFDKSEYTPNGDIIRKKSNQYHGSITKEEFLNKENQRNEDMERSDEQILVI